MENLPPFANLFHSTYLLGYQCCNIISKTHYTYWTMWILSFCTENHSWKMKNTDMVLQYLKYRYNQSYSLKGSNISSFIKILPVCMLVCKNIFRRNNPNKPLLRYYRSNWRALLLFWKKIYITHQPVGVKFSAWSFLLLLLSPLSNERQNATWNTGTVQPI